MSVANTTIFNRDNFLRLYNEVKQKNKNIVERWDKYTVAFEATYINNDCEFNIFTVRAFNVPNMITKGVLFTLSGLDSLAKELENTDTNIQPKIFTYGTFRPGVLIPIHIGDKKVLTCIRFRSMQR